MILAIYMNSLKCRDFLHSQFRGRGTEGQVKKTENYFQSQGGKLGLGKFPPLEPLVGKSLLNVLPNLS